MIFLKTGKIIHVDINPKQLEDIRYNALPIIGDVREFFLMIEECEEHFEQALQNSKEMRGNWFNQIMRRPYYDSENDRYTDKLPIHPARLLREVRDYAPRDTIIVADSGAHTFFTAHHWTSYSPNECFIWTNNGPMGYALAGGIGIKLALPEKPCLIIIGDGGMLMHGVEIQTAARYQIPIVVLVINNAALGNVYLRAFKDGDKGIMEATTSSPHNWAKFAQSLGAMGVVVERYEQLTEACEQAFSARGPFVIDARCGRDYFTPNPGESALL